MSNRPNGDTSRTLSKAPPSEQQRAALLLFVFVFYLNLNLFLLESFVEPHVRVFILA